MARYQWADPIADPKGNAEYWRNRRERDYLFAVLILVPFTGCLAWIVWQTHLTVQHIVGSNVAHSKSHLSIMVLTPTENMVLCNDRRNLRWNGIPECFLAKEVKP